MPKYLKDHVKAAGGTLLLQLDSVGSPFTNDRGKEVRHCGFRIKSDGTLVTEDIFAVKWKYGMKGVQQGDHVEGFINNEGYLDFKKVDASNSPSQSNYQQVQGERKATQSIQQADTAQAEKQWSIVLQAMTKTFGPAYFEFGRVEAKWDDMKLADAIVEFAGIMAVKIQAKAKELASGKPAEPDFSDVPPPDSEYRDF